MTPEQQIRAWAEKMAARFEGQVKTIPDARYRARALRDILNDIRPGLSNQVTAATVALQKQGVQPLDRALHEALVRRLEIYVKSILKAGGAFNTESDLGDMAGEALGTFDSAAFQRVMSSVTDSLSTIGEAAVGITSTVLESRQEREALAAREREAERQAAIEELRARGEVAEAERQAEIARQAEERRQRDLELREAQEESRARVEEARAEREAREEELALEEEARLRALRASTAGGGGGLAIALISIALLGGATAAGVWYMKKRKQGKKSKG